MNTSLKEIRKIDNTRTGTPLVTVITIAFLIVVGSWFVRGGSFRLYASLFFGLYSITQLSWLSIILVSVVQNVAFLPFRFLYEKYYKNLKDFEDEIEKSKKDDQYLMLNKKVRQGDKSVLFYIINFVFLTIAFVSAGRVFLLEFYRSPIEEKYLYSYIPYPEYPLKGVWFHFPFFKVDQTMALGWDKIVWILLIIIVPLVVARLLWRVLKPLLSRNQQFLKIRIAYNHVLYLVSGVVGVLIIGGVYFMRHIPVAFSAVTLSADLSVQNTTFNLITAIASFLVTVYGGWQHSKENASYARKMGIPENIIEKVTNEKMRESFRNGLLLGFSAFWLTRLMPCSHDLSVMAFEALYVLSPVTLDLLVPKSEHR